MKSEFLMGSNDGIIRCDVSEKYDSLVSEHLSDRLIRYAIVKSIKEISQFLDRTTPDLIEDKILLLYNEGLILARSNGLLVPNGIDEADFINLLVVASLLKPDFYCESGVFVGSSLLAFLLACPEADVLAIDPDLNQLRIPKKLLKNVKLRDDRDFNEITFKSRGGFVYFDDHINPAQRIISAKKAGFSFMLIDDAAGMLSIVQRRYPAIPAVQHILNHELFAQGDTIEWTVGKTRGFTQAFLEKLGIKSRKYKRNTFYFNDEVLKQMREAKCFISSVIELPVLSDWIAPKQPRWMPYNTKYLIRLRQENDE